MQIITKKVFLSVAAFSAITIGTACTKQESPSETGLLEDASKTTSQTLDSVKETSHNVADAAKESLDKGIEDTKKLASDVKDKAESGMDKAKDAASDVADATKDGYENTKDKAEELKKDGENLLNKF